MAKIAVLGNGSWGGFSWRIQEKRVAKSSNVPQ